jgi:hypothetical protein
VFEQLLKNKKHMNKQTSKQMMTVVQIKYFPEGLVIICFNKAAADNTDKCGIRIRFVVVCLLMLPKNKIIKHQW